MGGGERPVPGTTIQPIQQAPTPGSQFQTTPSPELLPGEQQLRELQIQRGIESAQALETFRPQVGIIPEGRLEEIGRSAGAFETRLRNPFLQDISDLRQSTLESLGARNILGGTEAAERLGDVGELQIEGLADISNRSIELQERFKSEELGRNLDRLAQLESGVSVPSSAALDRTRLEQTRLSQNTAFGIQQRQFEQDFLLRRSLAGSQTAASQAAASQGGGK